MALKANIKILVVDDISSMRQIIKGELAEIGFTNVTQADNGTKAWSMIESSYHAGAPFEFIISDWNMPELSGLELLKKIRSNPDLEKTPFLMVTAENEQGNVIMAINHGVNNFIVKPFSAEILKDKISRIFKRV
jgi:two-component system chemotaxis response regulator CheY